MRIRHYLRLLFTLSPAAIWQRVKKRTWQFTRRIQGQINGYSITELDFRKSLSTDIPDERALIQRIHHGPYAAFFIDDQKKEWTAQQFRDLCPGEEEAILRAANLAVQHIFDLLGSGPCALGPKIDWQVDFKTGHRWAERSFYANNHEAPYPGGYDIKIPWELSRCQHFAWLGQAYWLSGNETYAREFCAQVEHWTAHNPPELGVNWVCTMDVAIRAVNWLWGYAYFRHSPALSDAFHIHFYRSMLEHGRHILHNLEFSETLTSNHYLSNLVGLVYLGFLLPELEEARTWRDLGLRELESELFKQVYPDGADFESSTHYHRLVTELFLSATILAQMNGFTFSPNYLARLERMIDILTCIMRPDGSVPVVGDQDNGRLQRLKVWGNPDQEWTNFRTLVAAGSVWLQKPAGIKFANEDWAEAFWLLGPEAVRHYRQEQQNSTPAIPASIFLPDSGWAVLRDQDRYLLMDVGPVGQNGYGGHAHNDSLSIDVHAGGQSWIVDPGTFVYTADYQARHAFRRTSAHNTVHIPGIEQSQLDVEAPFQVKKPSITRTIHWEAKDSFSLVVAEVQFSSTPAILHRRAVLYVPEARAWLVGDWLSSQEQAAKIHLTFPPDVQAADIQHPFPGIQLTNDHGKSFWICSMGGEKPEITPGWVSSSYGIKKESLQAEFPFSGKTIQFWSLLPDEQSLDINTRIQILLKAWDHCNGSSFLKQ